MEARTAWRTNWKSSAQGVTPSPAGRARCRDGQSATPLDGKDRRRVKDALREHWRTACETVGIPEVKRLGPTGWHSFAGVSIHDLRRSAIRNMRRAGVDESVAMTISGHK